MQEKSKGIFRVFRSPLFWLVLILTFGAFLRLYHFSDWLHFELDQSRDARVIDDATLGGPGELTLLGMKASGSSLRLGPGFYYLEYVSALLFGDTPQGMAFFVPLLSIASIGLFYLFARRFFDPWVSLGLAALFSVSEYLVMYGRFAWNPNPIPFFSLLGFYALLLSVAKDTKHPRRWFVLSAFAIGFSTHLHFLAFFALPAIALLFLLVKRPRFPLKTWGLAFLAFFILYVPVVLNEIETNGANGKAFIETISEKSTKEAYSLPNKFIKNVVEHGLGYGVVLSGYEQAGFFSVKLENGGVTLKCDARCENGWGKGAMGIAFLMLSVIAMGFLARPSRALTRERSDMLLLSFLWFAVSFLLLLPLAYDFSPRFFLIAAPLPFLFLGFIFEAFRKVLPSRVVLHVLFFTLLFLLSGYNVYSIGNRFEEIRLAPSVSISTPTDRILKEHTRVSLTQQEMIVAYLKGYADRTGYPVYMHSEPEHRRALKYLLERAGVENHVLGTGDTYIEGIYVLILRSGSDLQDGMEKYLDRFEVVQKKSFGTLTLIEFRPKPEHVRGVRQEFPPEGTQLSDNPKAFPRYTWREWWDRKNDAKNDEEDGVE